MTPIERRVLRERLRGLVENGEVWEREIAKAEETRHLFSERYDSAVADAADLLPDMIAAMREAAAELGS